MQKTAAAASVAVFPYNINKTSLNLYLLKQIYTKVLTSMSYFCLASLLSKNMGIQGKSTPSKQQRGPLLSSSFALLQIKQGSQQAPQQPKMNLIIAKYLEKLCKNSILHVLISLKQLNKPFFHPEDIIVLI